MASVEQYIETALRDYFQSFADGMDVPPARRFFLEGYIQALVDAKLLSAEEIRRKVFDCCSSCLGEDSAARYLDAASPLILHSHMRRAPVYPTS